MFDEEAPLSFSPTLKRSKKYAKIESNYSQMQPIMQNIADKQQAKLRKIDEIRKEQEHEEMKECSFAPKAKPLASSQSCNDIRGLERFLHLKSLAEKLKMQQRDREAKVFMLNPTNDTRVTVPIPFSFQRRQEEGKQAKTQKHYADRHAQLRKFRTSLETART